MTTARIDPERLAAAIRLTSAMLGEADRGEWLAVTGLEQQRQSELMAGGAQREVVDDDHVRVQLMALLQLNDTLARKAGAERDELKRSLAALRCRRSATRIYGRAEAPLAG